MNPKYHLLVAVAALSLGACSTDDSYTDPVPENGGYKISFTVTEDTETRTTLEMLEAGSFLRWVSTDKVGIYTVGKNGESVNSNIVTTADVSESPVEFVGTLEQQASSGDMFYAYYPYNAEQQSTDPSAVKLTIPAEQQQTKAGVYNGESHPLVAVPMKFSQEWGNAGRISSVRFRQLGAIVELQLYSSNEALCSESIRSVTFESETALAGDFSFDLTSVTVKDALPISGYESKKATTSLEAPAAIPAAKDKAARVYLTIAPGQYTGLIVVRTNVAKYTFRLKSTMDFGRAVIKGLPADLAKAERDIIILFEDPEVKRICVENWDTDGDGDLSNKEAAAVKSIGSLFKRKSISSFNELQYFTRLQSIGNSAFEDCARLTSINLPDGLITIGESAFCNCNSLTNINIPDGVTSIGDYAFQYCHSLTSIHIPNGVTTIGAGVFDRCSSLTSIKLSNRVTSIGDSAFYNCTSLMSINLSEGLITIGKGAFRQCSSLTSIQLPDGVTTIGSWAFDECSNLTSIHIPDGVTSIGDSAFKYCSSLTSINIPQTISSIGEQTFAKCASLSAFYGEYASADHRCLILDGALLAFAPADRTEYTIPNGVTSIRNSAFYSCSNLTNIHIPNGVTSIGNSAFEDCVRLTSINLPDGLITIGESAFYNCNSLTSIHIPDGVTSIGDYAFKICSNLTSINIPLGVTAIGKETFFSCYSLTNINLPNGVTTIGIHAFDNCSNLTSINLPDGLITIGAYAFYRCYRLTSVYCKPTTPPTIDSSTFYHISSSMKFYVPAASVEAYKTAEVWSEYASQIVADNN